MLELANAIRHHAGRVGQIEDRELRQKLDRVDSADDPLDSCDDGWKAIARVSREPGKVCSEIDVGLVWHLARRLLRAPRLVHSTMDQGRRSQD